MKCLLLMLLLPVSLMAQKIEAEAYKTMKGVQLETTADAGLGKNLSYIDNGDYMEYEIAPAVAGRYEVQYRVASLNGASFSAFGKNIIVPKSGGYQSWVTLRDTVSLYLGKQVVRLTSTSANYWNINWIQITPIPIIYEEVYEKNVSYDYQARKVYIIYENGKTDSVSLPSRPVVIKQ